MKDFTHKLLRCPKCYSTMKCEELEFVCSNCNTKYDIVDKIPILRKSLCPYCEEPITEGVIKCQYCGKQIQYVNPKFLSVYYEAHYGPYLKYTSRDDRFISRAVTENFYQTIFGLCNPYLTKDSIVLDVGCATGRLSMELAKRANFVIGIDYSRFFIQEALNIVCSRNINDIQIFDIGDINKNFFRATLNGFEINNCDFVVGDAQSLPFDEDVFDFISSSNLIDRVKDPLKTIDESHRVLKRGGFILITDPFDWDEEKSPSDVSQWKCSIQDFLDEEKWKTVSTIDGIPFAFRYHSRHTRTFYNQILIAKKI